MWASTSRQFLYVPVKKKMTTQYFISASIVRKREIVRNQSERGLFYKQTTPGLSAPLYQLTEGAFLLPELALCYKQAESANVEY